VIDVEDAFLCWVVDSASGVALPGRGDTWSRFVVLSDAAALDLSLGRLGEGHLDALAILAEAGHDPAGNGPYAVWAARAAEGDLVATPTSEGWRIDGRKGFCSGAGMVERALVTADAPDGPRLFDLEVTGPGVEVCPQSWPAVGMAGSASSTVLFRGVAAHAPQAIGPPGFYTERVGFWWGAAGVAACWWGGARALLDTVGRYLQDRAAPETELAAFGAASARYRSISETLRWAASEIDEGRGQLERARRAALVVREVVHDGCVTILALAAAAGGARPICLDAVQSRRSADLYAYLAQHHGGRDAVALGRELVGRPGVGA
jgi:alkylation response protein AidB-like acyl-CoA dehydrogenase